MSRLVDSRPIRSLWSSASASLHCSLFSPDAPAFPLPRVIHALTSAFYAGDGAVSTIGDVLRATADVAPRGREGIDPQFLSTLAQDCISGSMLKVLVAKGDAMTADAAQTPGDSGGGRGSGGRGGGGRGSGGRGSRGRGSGGRGSGGRSGGGQAGGAAPVGKRLSRSSYTVLLNLCPETKEAPGETRPS